MQHPHIHLPISEYRLANGLHVILHPDPSVPVVAVEVMYHVGSRNELPGHTGLAHLFEHMMFKGSENVPDGEHFHRLQAVGGQVNGSTNEDRTNYYELVPADQLDLALYLESDRMGALLPALTQEKLDNQRDVVRNERRQSYENQPYGLAHETLMAALYPPDYPHHWPVIGSMEDLASASLDDVRAFFHTYYAPENACLVLAGNFQTDHARNAIERYFGPIPSHGEPARPVIGPGVLDAPRTIELQDAVQLPRLYIAWHGAPWNTRDDVLLDVFTDILSSGKNSRLYRSLVVDQQCAQSVITYHHGLECTGRLAMQITPRTGHTIEDVRASAMAIAQQLLDKGPEPREIEKSINMNLSQHIHGLSGMLHRADAMATYHTLGGSAQLLNTYPERFQNITPEEVRACASRVLARPQVTLTVVPKKDGHA
jgi:zinc protease